MTSAAGDAVRPARLSDDRGIAEVHVRGWRETYPGMIPDRVLAALNVDSRKRYWRRLMLRGGPGFGAFVAERDARIVGFAISGPDQVGMADYPGEFQALYVLRAAQGSGLGTALMAAMAASLVGHGMTAAMVWALHDNWRARRFYEKLGGRLVADRPLDFDGTTVMEVAYGWTDITPLARLAPPAA